MERCLEGGGGRGDAELGPPLAEHLVDLLLEDGGVGGAALLAGGLEAGEDLLEVVHAGLGAVTELLVSRRRARTLPRGGTAAGGGRIARHRADQGGVGASAAMGSGGRLVCKDCFPSFLFYFSHVIFWKLFSQV